MSQIYEEDILNTGKNQVIISNDNMRVIIVPELGGRIADIQFNDGKGAYLHRTYPEGVSFGPYTEYGGIEECIGTAPGSLWNVQWRCEQKASGALLQALSKSILVQKLISLDEEGPIVKIDYSFFNLGNTFSKFTFGIHPEVCIGGSLKDNQYHIPIGVGTLLTGESREPGFKDKVLPTEGWCAITCGEKAFGQMFPGDIIDTVEVYYPRINTHLVLEPIIFSVGVSPDKCASFTYMVYVGDGDAEKIREVRAAREAELSAKYQPFSRDEVPDEVMAELRDKLGREQRAGFQIVMPEFPKMPDMSAIIRGTVGNITGMSGRKIETVVAAVKPTGTGRTKDWSPDTEIHIEHLKGNITIHGWEHPYVEYTDMRGNVSEGEGAVKLETNGDYTLKIPGETPRITLNFVSGDIALFDIASSFKITGVSGRVDVISAKVPDDGTLDISLVKGNISLTIPQDSSCRISAISLSKEIASSDLTMKSVSDETNLNAVMNDGKASIILNTTKGMISILGRLTAKDQRTR